ncbi:phosphatidate phosphatase PAH2 [Mangifera indica]|uniref:phosphatidate phosphatase PAH2 n=1 Tax=Mangifera indica TaxID=29780 RepID=UPI001CF9A39C|nr:phosphatidate phosphatase PAH2 [Mangifera indica]
MYTVGRIGSYISRGVYTVSGPFHPFGGAVDIIVVEQPDGSFKSSPWYVKFGKFQGVLKTKEKVVSISVNEVEADFHMYLDHKGEAYFLKEVDFEEGESVLYPSSSSDEMDGQSNSKRRSMKSKSCNYDADKLNLAGQIDASNKNAVARSGSGRARWFVFGRRPMKDNDFKEGEGDASVSRINSLERAEIAADLLEVKWSTNLASGKSRQDNASRFSAADVLDDNVVEHIEVKASEIQVESSVGDDWKNRTDDSVPDRDTVSLFEQMDGCPISSSENLETSTVEGGMEVSSIGTMEPVAETPLLGESSVEANCVIVTEISRTAGDFAVGNAEQAHPDLLSEYELEECHSKLSVKEQACDEEDPINPGCRVSEESGSDHVQSFVYCETSQSSIIGLENSNNQAQETLCLTSGGCGEVHVHEETVHVTIELPSKDTAVNLAKHIDLEKELAQVSDMDIGNPITLAESNPDMVCLDPPLCSTIEVDSQNICFALNVSSEVQDGLNITDDVKQSFGIGDSERNYGDIVMDKSGSDSLVESSEEEQFPFRFKFFNLFEKDNHLAYCGEGIKAVNGLVDANDESCSSSDMFDQYNPLTDLENSMEKSRVISGPVSVPGSHKAVEEVGRLAESLPNIWSPTIAVTADDCDFPVSHSLDSNSRPLNWTLLKENDSSCIKSDADKEQQMAQEQPNIDNNQELKSALSSTTVEISLCKHLLWEGMGANAASQAFDAEKLDIEKFTSLGPAILKDDRLIVRIGGHYFPWDVAAPFVLGMVAFGIKEMSEPKGMIPVDQVEKFLVGDPSKTIVSPSGSWRIWPFTLGRSKSRRATRPAQSDTKSSDAEVSSVSIDGMNEANNVSKPKMAKKMVRAITPTSEQLASLNLKEGRNSVTFTFSTAMLGKQQVDARIYLWKWNTRIVISDVDGTITKSDVLGQFMPMVGMDWSQTGVAHLFSAIKENGYQLLFLSARAISQAYHTRRFLFNLKQDGKALPDGPVVISPDGVFPSLYREVIRRAPHEFKIACLEDIRALFPSDCNPFYAGFGNRDTDEISYLKVGIPKGKIFIINPKGEVAVSRRVDTKSYSSLHALVHGMFPSTTSSEQEDFNSWNFWRLPPPDIDV